MPYLSLALAMIEHWEMRGADGPSLLRAHAPQPIEHDLPTTLSFLHTLSSFSLFCLPLSPPSSDWPALSSSFPSLDHMVSFFCFFPFFFYRSLDQNKTFKGIPERRLNWWDPMWLFPKMFDNLEYSPSSLNAPHTTHNSTVLPYTPFSLVSFQLFLHLSLSDQKH